jgi:endonuclease/exonuclease/phosphatase family metal-dependent hydrolase
MSDPSELRVMTYNVRSLRDDVGAIADVIRSAEPDVVAVQEAPRFLRWRSKRAALARRSGLVVGTADRTGGLLLMTSLRARVVATDFALLPKSPRLHQRAVAIATVDAGGHRWRVASVHFSLNAAERRNHLPALWSAVGANGSEPATPLVIAGDLNEPPGGPVFTELAERMQDCYAAAGGTDGSTSPAAAPRQRLDAIFVSSGCEVVSCEVIADGAPGASDHLPVLAVLRPPSAA